MDVCSFFLFLIIVSDKLYGNNATGSAAKATDSSGTDNTGYGTFFQDGSNLSSPPVSSSNSGNTNTGSYKSMPPPADQESPYSYGYGEEKKKMLTQTESQGDDYSMYSTAYPSSVTGGQGYNNYGK